MNFLFTLIVIDDVDDDHNHNDDDNFVVATLLLVDLIQVFIFNFFNVGFQCQFITGLSLFDCVG